MRNWCGWVGGGRNEVGLRERRAGAPCVHAPLLLMPALAQTPPARASPISRTSKQLTWLRALGVPPRRSLPGHWLCQRRASCPLGCAGCRRCVARRRRCGSAERGQGGAAGCVLVERERRRPLPLAPPPLDRRDLGPSPPPPRAHLCSTEAELVRKARRLDIGDGASAPRWPPAGCCSELARAWTVGVGAPSMDRRRLPPPLDRWRPQAVVPSRAARAAAASSVASRVCAWCCC